MLLFLKIFNLFIKHLNFKVVRITIYLIIFSIILKVYLTLDK